MNTYDHFVQLHHQGRSFLLGNVWDAASARIFEYNGYQAIGTSSAAIAQTFGYDDGENISFEDLFFIVNKIVRVVKIPVTVDMEAGYSKNIRQVAVYLEKLYQAGVAGINIEDSKNVGGKSELDSIDRFCRKLSFLRNYLDKKNMKIFINARTDAYLLGLQDSLELTCERVLAYERAGADGVFVPGLKQEDEIRMIVESIKLPVNLLCHEGMLPLSQLSEIGIRRISMGPYGFQFMQSQFDLITRRIKAEQSFARFFTSDFQTSIAS